MSIRLDGNVANYLSRTATVPDYNSAYTAMGWLKWKVDNAATQSALSLSPASAANCFDFFGIINSPDLFVVSSRLDDDDIQSTGGSAATVDKWVHWALVRNSVSDIRIYIDLAEDAQVTLDITGRVAADICSIGRLSVGGAGFVPLDAEVAFTRIWSTSLSLAEITAERLSRRAVKTANLFGDYPMLDSATAGSDVSGNGNHFTVNGTITTGASEPPLIAGPSLFRGRGFSFFDDEEVNRFEFWPAVGGAVDLVVQDATHTHAAENVSVTQVHELVAQSATHAHSAENVVVAQVHSLQVQDAAHGHVVDNVVVAQAHVLAVQGADHEHSAEQLTLTQVHNLTVESATHAHSADNIVLTQVHNLAVDSALHAHTAENVALTQVHALVVQSAEHVHSAENVALTQTHELDVQSAAHAHTADNVTVDQAVLLVVQNATHGHTTDSPSLTQTHVLTIQDSNHSHAADNVILEQVVQLVVASAVHAHSATSPVLIQVHSLVVASTTHAHTAQNVSLFIGVISIPANRTFVVESGSYEVEVGTGDYEFVDDYEDSEVLVS